MNAAGRRRRLLRLAALVTGQVLACAAFAQAPEPGRYRCYESSAQIVMAWFDLGGGTVSINGDAPRPVRIDPATARIDLPRDALPPYRHGFYFPPRASDTDAGRFTIVLARGADARPGRGNWAALPRCYLITH